VSGFSRTAGQRSFEISKDRHLDGTRSDHQSCTHPVCCWTQSAMAAGG